MGQVISDLARRALTQPVPGTGLEESQTVYIVDDFPVFPQRNGSPVTSDMVRRLQDALDMEDAEQRPQTESVPDADRLRR